MTFQLRPPPFPSTVTPGIGQSPLNTALPPQLPGGNRFNLGPARFPSTITPGTVPAPAPTPAAPTSAPPDESIRQLQTLLTRAIPAAPRPTVAGGLNRGGQGGANTGFATATGPNQRGSIAELALLLAK